MLNTGLRNSMALSFCLAGCAILAASVLIAPGAFAEDPSPAPRIVTPIDDSRRLPLEGSTHPLARAEFDRGTADEGLPMERMLLVLQRPPALEASLIELLAEMSDRNSAHYHEWLTPEQFGARFGAAQQDIDAIQGWLKSHGLTVNRVTNGRDAIEFSGTAGQIRQTFHTAIHAYEVNGERHYANASNPEVPAAIAPAVVGIVSMNDFRSRPSLHVGGVGKAVPVAGSGSRPAFNFYDGNNDLLHALTPADIYTIYDEKPLLTGANKLDGTGQTIAIAGRSNIETYDYSQFRSFFLPFYPANNLQIIVDGFNPGYLGTSDTVESTSDIEIASATAPNATIDLVVSGSTIAQDGIGLSALYIVDNNLAPIVSVSYMQCEAQLGTAGNQFWSNVWEQAAAQGITALVISGDDGPAMCDGDPSATGNPLEPAVPTHAPGVNGLGSSPYNLSVGGTSFDEGADPSQYWAASETIVDGSALSYIPEKAWNESCSPATCGAAAANFTASTGGPSSCTVSTLNAKGQLVCSAHYAKPSWQLGIGVPADGARDLPDVALSSAMHDPYLLCYSFNCSTDGLGGFTVGYGWGTSMASPAMAGVMALVAQKEGTLLGNAAPEFYRLASSQAATLSTCNSSVGPAASCIFHDVTRGNTNVPCVGGSPDCSATKPMTYGTLTGFSSGVGYDMTTGVGTVDFANLVNAWGETGAGTKTTLTLTPPTLVHGHAASITGTVAPKTGAGTPTGEVAILTTITVPNTIAQGPVALTKGAFSDSLAALPGGKYNVYARYGGDSTFAASESAGKSITVTPEPSKILLKTYNAAHQPFSHLPATMPYGSALNQIYSVQGKSGFGTATGTLTVSVTEPGGSEPLFTPEESHPEVTESTFTTPEVLNVDGAASFYQYFFFAPGQKYTFSASYAGDPSFEASTLAKFTITIVKAPTTLALTCSPATVTAAGRDNCNVQTSTQSSGDYLTGEVAIFDGKNQIAAAPLNNFYDASNNVIGATSQLSIPGTALSPGANSLTAVYAGDTNYAAATSSAVTVTLSGQGMHPGAATTTALSGASSSATSSQVLTLTATVTSGSNPVTGGTVTFLNGNAALGTVQLIGNSPASGFTTGTAVLATRLPLGANSITARYNGLGSTWQPSVSSASSVTVSGTVNTFTQISVSEDSTNLANFDFVATVSGLSRTSPAGQVTFNDTTATTTLGMGTLAPAATPFGIVHTANAAIGDGYTQADGLAIAVADVNHDGFPDAVVTDEYKNTVSVLLGNGEGTFQAAVPYVVGSNPQTSLYMQNVLLVDLNQDGNLDIVTSDFSGNVWVLLGTGTGTFDTATSFPAGASEQQMVSADFNNDGIPDIAMVSQKSNSVVVLLGKGDGTFSAPKSTTVAALSYGLVAADVNLDGKTDLIAYGQNGIQLLTGKGDGTFVAAATPLGPSVTTITYTVNAVVAADLNGDGIPDLAAIAQYGSGAVAVMLGNGDGTFQPPQFYFGTYVKPLGVQTLSAADINGDGVPDLITMGTVGYASEFTVFLGSGDGTFNPVPVTYTVAQDGTQNYPGAFVLADLNGDGIEDAVAVFAGSDPNNALVASLGTTNASASLPNIALPGAVAQQIQGQYTPATDSIFNASTSALLSVNPQLSGPQVSLTATNAIIYYGQPAQIYFKVQPSANYTGNSFPTGSMKLIETLPNGTVNTYGPYALYAGTGYSYVYLDYNYGLGGAGVFSFMACYSGDSNFESGCTTSAITITCQTDTSATVLSAPAGVLSGDPVWVSFAVTTPSYPSSSAFGTVTLFDGKTQLGTPVFYLPCI